MVKTMKRMSFFCFLSGLILVLIFHQPIITSLASWFLRAYSNSKWGKPLEYEQLQWNGHQLVLLHPQFKNDISFAAERMILGFHFNWRKRHLSIDVEIEQPHWHMATPLSSRWNNWEKLLKQEKKWIKTSSNLHIRTALFSWISEDSNLHKLHFDLETNSQEGGAIQVYFDPQNHNSNYLILNALSKLKAMEIKCSCQQVDCFSLFALTKFLGIDSTPWLITSGKLQGQLTALFPGIKRPHLEGELMIEQLAFCQREKALEGKIEQARLKLEKNSIAYESSDPVPTFIGQIDILKPASFAYYYAAPSWSIDQIEGSIQLNSLETAFINLNAKGGNADHFSNWKLQGEANLNAQRSLNLNLTLFCASIGKPEGKIHLSFQQPQRGYKHAEIQLEKVSYGECGFLQTLLATFWPKLEQFKLEQGELNALVEATVTDRGVRELQIKQFEASHLCSKFKRWNAICYFNQIKGHGKIDLGNQDFWQSIDAGLHLEDGNIQFDGMSPHVPMNDIQAHLIIQNGCIDHSLVTLQLAGLKGKMDVEWGKHKQLLTFKLDGVVQDLASFLPKALQGGLRQHFYDNRLMVLANIKRQNQQIELGGTFHIERADTHQMDLIHFGCELKKMGKDANFKLVPSGWFYAHHLPLEKFLSPFIFRNGVLCMKGEGEFKGSFDDQQVTIKYDAENLKLENENLLIEVKQLHSPIPGQLVGSHQIDLNSYSHQGALPIQQASYFEKNTGLIFQDIQGLVAFKDQVIRILPVETYCNGVYFAGALEFDYSDPAPGVFDLKVHCPTFSGKVSQIQHLLAHLEQPSLLNKIPLEGEILAKEEGIILDFNFVPKDYTLRGNIKGAVVDGSLPFESADMALKGIYMDVDYHHQPQLLEFSDIQGTLLVGKPRRVEEYLFTGQHIRLHHLSKPDIELDIAVNDHEKELLRLVGYTREEEPNLSYLYLDQTLSHVSCIYPHVWKCCLKDWSHIEQFEFRSQFSLAVLLQDLKRFRQTGLLFLSHSLIDKMTQFLPIEGQGSCVIQSYPDQSYTYQLEGLHITRDASSEHHALLKGSKQDKKWIIEQLQWDDLTAYAELQQTTDKWKIPFLGLNDGQTLLLGLEGDFNPDEAVLRAKLNFCDINLAKVDRYEALQAFTKKWWPKGYLKATGNIEWAILPVDLWEGLKVSLQAEVENLAFRDYSLKGLRPFQIDIQGKRSFCLQNARFAFFPKNDQAYIDLKQLDYQFSQNYFDDLQFAFQIPSHDLQEIGESLYHHFPEFLDDSLKENLINLKPQGYLRGIFAIDHRNPIQRSFKLILDDGVYQFKKREYNLKQAEFQKIADELRFTAISQYERCPLQILIQTKWPTCQKGLCTLSSYNGSKLHSPPLVIKWENQPQRGLVIRSMKGEFIGCSFLLTEDKESTLDNRWIALQGQMTFDFNRLCPLLTSEMAEMIQKLKIGSAYCFNGNLWANAELGDTLLETLSLKGNLTSHEAILKGYQVQTLQTDVQYVPGRLDLQNFLIRDPAGSLKAAHLIATWDRNKDRWTLFIPRFSVKNLRLNLLRDTESSHVETSPKLRSLVVKRLDVQNFSGELSHVDTWQAEGSLHFLNPSRKTPFHPLLAIPAEIILRLGLDPQVLNPITGMIYFNLQGDRFYLTRFKDVYSEGRGSKFYLAQTPTPSWMDFNGNLHVQVRMKQYNLIFKIAELFTVSIQGNIKRPRYSLQKQSKASHKAQSLPVINQEK